MMSNSVVIYEHINYEGTSTLLVEGDYDINSFGLKNDQLSSLRVPSGIQVTLYEHANFQGRTKTFTQDTPNVGDEFNDITSAIRVKRSSSIDRAILKKYAPKIYLHPYDNHRPISVENYYKNCVLYNASGELISQLEGGVKDLLANNQAGNYLRFKSGLYPTGHDDFHTGDAIVDSGNGKTGICQSPVYVKYFTYDTHIDIKYIFFYAFNGFQTFRVGAVSGLSTKKRNFMWARFARHEGDWEHITVRLSPDLQTIQGVFYAQHSHNQYVKNVPLDGTHPIVYSALNSHASYPVASNIVIEDILKPPGLVPIGWLKVIDTTSTYTDDLRFYTKPSPLFETVEWKPWQNDNQLISVDNELDATTWQDFKGYWGTPKFDNSHIDRPPSMPSNVHDRLFDLAKVANTFKALEKYTVGSGPRTPSYQGNWWNDKEPYPA